MHEFVHSTITYQELLVSGPVCTEHQNRAIWTDSTLRMYEYRSQKQNTQIANILFYLKLCVHWTWKKEGMLSDWTVPKFMHYAQETKFLMTCLTCPEGAQLSVVYCSVHETCAEQLLLHYSVTFSPYVTYKRKTKNILKYDILSVFSVHVLRARPNEIAISVRQEYSKLRIMYKKWRFHDTSVQVVQIV